MSTPPLTPDSLVPRPNFRKCPHCGSERPRTEAVCGFCQKAMVPYAADPLPAIERQVIEATKATSTTEKKLLNSSQCVGLFVAGVGACQMLRAWAFFSIQAPSRSLDGGAVVNYGLMNDRIVLMILGTGLFIGGLILYRSRGEH